MPAGIDPSISADDYVAMRDAGATWWMTYFISNDDNAVVRLQKVYAENVPMAAIEFDDQGDGTSKLKIECPYADGGEAEMMLFATQMLHAGLDHAGLDRSIVQGATLWEQPDDEPMRSK